MEYTNKLIREIIEDYIHSERDRAVLIRRLTDKIPIERLAEEFDLSVSQTKRIIKKNQTIIFSHYPP